RKEYLQQKLSLQELMDRYERGATTLAGFRQGAMALKGSLDLLDDSDLSQLNSAIASAEQQMRSLGDSARSTLESTRDELDRLRGDEEAIERRRMASRRRELQAQLAEARASGNSQAVGDLQQAIGMLSAIASETAQAREQEERSNRRAPTEATAPGAGAQPEAATAAPTTVIRLESARGSAVDVAVPQGQEDALLSILEQSGLRTI
ncbi:MAG: tape measure domain-containing protein, partial [Pseudomonas sp.]